METKNSMENGRLEYLFLAQLILFNLSKKNVRQKLERIKPESLHKI
jgi:hypothetical protein